MKPSDPNFPYLGFGLGLRIPHYAHIFEHRPDVDWFEIISENFMDTQGKARRNLARIRENYPIVMHGVSLSIGSVDVLNSEYLRKLKSLVHDIEPAWISDHLCWTGVAHRNLHDLLPVPYTEQALDHIVARVQQVQDFLGRPIALENPSTYLEFAASQIPEAEFIAELARRSGCRLLLDVNNVYVSCFNHRQDPKRYLDTLPLDQVVQVHLSGHSNFGTHIIDTHDDHVVEPVWAMYEYVLARAGRPLNTMIEWDAQIPPWETLYAELDKAKTVARQVRTESDLPALAQLGQNCPPANSTGKTVPVELEATQRRMQEVILQGHPAATDAAQWVLPKTWLDAPEQIGIYIHAYRARLREVMSDDFPVLQHCLGGARFDALIDGFIDATQSFHFNIGLYPASFPAYLASALPDDTFAQELAELESTLSKLQDAPESVPLTQQNLAGLTSETLQASVLLLRSASSLLAFTYPVEAWYTAVQKGQEPELPDGSASYLLAYRHDDVVWRMDLDANEFEFLQNLMAGATVGAAIEALQQSGALDESTLSAALSQWFSRWMANGVFRYCADLRADPLACLETH